MLGSAEIWNLKYILSIYNNSGQTSIFIISIHHFFFHFQIISTDDIKPIFLNAKARKVQFSCIFLRICNMS